MSTSAWFAAWSRRSFLLVAATSVLTLGCNPTPPGGGGPVAGGGASTETSASSEEGAEAPAGGEAPAGALSVEGAVEVDGSSTVYPISEAAAAEFKKSYAKVNVSVGKSGTGGGFKRFVTGEIDISGASRPIKKDELDQAKTNGVEFIELPVAYDGLSIVVNKDNDWADEITLDQLKKIFLADAPAKTWKDVDPTWPDEAIKIYSPGTDSGTFDYFKEVVAGKEGALRDDMSLSEDDNNLVRGIEGDKHAIGYFGAAYYFADKESLKALKVVNPETNEAVAVDPETIKSGDYAPFGRPLFIYVNAAKADQPQTDEFVRFYLDRAGELAKMVQYVELPAEVYAAAKTHFEERKTGSHYYDADGAAKEGTLEELFVAEHEHE